MILDLLTDSNTSQGALSVATNVSWSYTNKVVTGKQLPNAGWLDLVATVMNLPEERTLDLHQAAAEDLVRRSGYRTKE